MNRRAERSVELLEQRLLHAARLERPDAAARRRAALALAGGALVGSASTNAAAAVVTAGGMKATGGTAVVAASLFAGVGKAVAIGAISGAVVLGASQTFQPSRLRQTPSVGTVATAGTPVVSNPRPDLAHPTPAPSSAVPPLAQAPEIETTPPSKVIGPRVTPTTQEATREPRAVPAPSPVDRTGEASPLAGEIAVIDRAREALMAGDSDRTLAIVDDYERTRTAPRLAAEAAVLRIEALSQRGERTRAAALASAFLRDHPQSPVADRMRAIVDASSK